MIDHLFKNSIEQTCRSCIQNGLFNSAIIFFTQHSRSGIIFRADPCYLKSENKPWYDWAYIDWGESNQHRVPAKLLLFMEVKSEDFQKPFNFGSGVINEPGTYAVIQTFGSNCKEKAHLTSMLVEYGSLMKDELNEENFAIYGVSVDSIVAPCCAIPFNHNESIWNASDWILLKPRDMWYDIFTNF